MHRLAELEDDVVRDVDDRADAALPGATQALSQPQRRRPGVVDVDEQAVVEPRAGRSGGERHRRTLRQRADTLRRAAGGRRDRRAVRSAEGGAGERRGLAREAAHGHRVATVRRDRELEHRVVEIERLPQVGADGRIGGQFEDAVRDLGEAEFLGRAQHAGGFHAAQFRGLDLEVAGEHRPDLRERGAQTSARVGGAADDLQLRAARRHAADLQLVGLRMPLGGEDLGHHHAAEGRRRGGDRLELETGERHARAELARRETRVDPVLEPGQRQLHAAPNWRRNRRSLSKNKRRSLTP